MRSPFRKRRFDSAASLGVLTIRTGAGLGLYVARIPFPPSRARGLGASSPSRTAQAIATAEGFGPSGNIPTIANNPGDLELGNIGYGTTGAAGGQQITNFPTADAGWAALENQITMMATGSSSAGYTPSMSIAQVGQLYSGGSSAWANNVASALGVDPSTNFASVVTGSAPATSPSTAGASTVPDLSSILSSDGTSTDNTGLYAAAGIGVGALVLAVWALS